MTKLPKRQVNYREGSPLKRCGNCSMYRRGGTCTLVDGEIKPADVCDRWAKAEPKEAASALWPA